LIEGFFFGPADHQVFAVYHSPAGPATGGLVVVCPPLLAEYMRTHHALREVAIGLAERGRHVIRLDYRGTGDSSGDLEGVSVEDWMDDIDLAVREGREITGARDVRLCAVRAGALLACAAGARTLARKYVLWDPVVDGASYIEGLQRMQASALERNYRLRRKEREVAAAELAGYGLPARLLTGLQGLGRDIYASLPAEQLAVVLTDERAAFAVPGVRSSTTVFDCMWDTGSEDRITPRPVIEQLIDELVES
jgi:alpha-beta hydrolase superfamily lysophospholipase